VSKRHIPFETTHKQEEMLKEDDSVSVTNWLILGHQVLIKQEQGLFCRQKNFLSYKHTKKS